MEKIFERVLKCCAVLVLACSLSACTGSAHYLANISEADLQKVESEIETKKIYAKKYKRSDNANRAMVKRVFKRLNNNVKPLCEHTGYEQCYFKVVYKPEDVVNAYAYESHKIAMYRGLMQYLRTDDEVAFVLAHEMGHHLGNHNKEKMRNAAVGATISGLLTAAIIGAASQNSYYDYYQQRQNEETIKNMTNVGAQLGALSYSKEEEREADLLGQYLMVRSGYSLKKAEHVVWLLLDLETTGGSTINKSAFGESHPAGPERIAAWRHVVDEIKRNSSKLPYKVNEGPGSSAGKANTTQRVPKPSRKPK